MAPPSRNVLATTDASNSASALHCVLSLLPIMRVRKKTFVVIKVRFEAIRKEERGAI